MGIISSLYYNWTMHGVLLWDCLALQLLAERCLSCYNFSSSTFFFGKSKIMSLQFCIGRACSNGYQRAKNSCIAHNCAVFPFDRKRQTCGQCTDCTNHIAKTLCRQLFFVCFVWHFPMHGRYLLRLRVFIFLPKPNYFRGSTRER